MTRDSIALMQCCSCSVALMQYYNHRLKTRLLAGLKKIISVIKGLKRIYQKYIPKVYTKTDIRY